MRSGTKMRSLAAAVAIAITGPVLAGVDTATDGVGDAHALTGIGGELFVTAFDAEAKKGYIYDLGGAIGRTTGGLLTGGWNNNANHSVDLAAQGWGDFVSLMGATGLSNVKWMVGSTSNHYGPDMASGGGNGLYRAVETTASVVGDLSTGQHYQIMQGFAETFLNAVNGKTTPDGEMPDPAVNSYFMTGELGAVFNPGEPGWASGWSNSFPGTVSAALGEQLDMYRYGANATEDPTTPASFEKYPGKWTLTAAGLLTYTVGNTPPPPPPVPVPAAVWLLGSALLGLAGIARRKRSDMSA